MERVGIVVVGGGPAGASAAWAAARAGAEVSVFEAGVPREDRRGLGPDSTDAAGILDYWVDLMDLGPDGFPEDVIFQVLGAAEFIGPTERVEITTTGISSAYPHFGFTYDRARFDDWLRARADEAGADYRVGTAVERVDTDLARDPPHRVRLRDGTELEAGQVILADGPQRRVTMGVLDQFLPEGRAERALGSRVANHIAYQEYRRFPDEIFDAETIKFWWGFIPGHTAYPWVFPNEEPVARVGLTMPIGVELDGIPDRDAYGLLRPDDERIPPGGELIERLLEYEYGGAYDLDAFPVVRDRGKREGTETYPISSTHPIDSPVDAGVAVTGGAMGATSAFHEGGGHLAVRTGLIAGELAAEGRLRDYNAAWKAAVGAEVLRNVAMARLVDGYGPSDWDHAFRVANRVLGAGTNGRFSLSGTARAASAAGLRLLLSYWWRKYRYGGGRYVQIKETEYAYPRIG